MVEDIVDSGLTVQYLMRTLSRRKPRSLKVCTLLSKPGGGKLRWIWNMSGLKFPISLWWGMVSITGRSTAIFRTWRRLIKRRGRSGVPHERLFPCGTYGNILQA